MRFLRIISLLVPITSKRFHHSTSRIVSAVSKPTDSMTSFAMSGSLHELCDVSREACDIMSPMISLFYNAINSETSKLKADASVFTIADGIVQVSKLL